MKKFYKSRLNFSVVLLFMLVLCQWTVGYTQSCTATVTGTVGLSTLGNVNELVYGNGIYVAAGSRGGIYMSTDGKAWSAVKNSTFNNSTYVGLAFGNGRFVATAGNATLVTSTDGINWTLMSMPGAANLGKVAFGNGMFITMASTGGMSYRSTDGVNWTAKATGALDNTNNIIFANGAFMAGEYVNSVGSYSYTSTDGITWVKRTIGAGTSNLNRLSYINNKFWTFHSGGAIYSSADGITWAQLTDPVGNTTDPGTQAFGGLWDGSKYFFFGTGGGNSSAIWTSTNGTAFTLQPKSIRMTASNAAFVNGKYFMLGSGTPISYSDNGTDWFYVTSDQNAMVKGGGKYVTVGNVGALGGQIMTSTDFSSWTKLSVNNIPPLFGVVYANSKFTAVGEVGAVLNSTDGTTWTAATSNFATRLNSVVHAQGLYVAAGVAGIIRSTDGVNWTSSYGGTGTPTFTKVKFLNNQFIAVGSIRVTGVTSGVVFTSPDGITWTDATPTTFAATPAYFTGVAWNGTQYLLTGLERTTGKFISMLNNDLSIKTGYTDILTDANYGSDGTRGDVVYDRGVFVSSANSLTTPINTAVLTSKDGKSWTKNDYVNTNVVSPSYVTAIFADANDFKLLGTHDGRFTAAPSCAVTTPAVIPFVGVNVKVTEAGNPINEYFGNVPVSTTDTEFDLSTIQNIFLDVNPANSQLKLTIANSASLTTSFDLVFSGGNFASVNSIVLNTSASTSAGSSDIAATRINATTFRFTVPATGATGDGTFVWDFTASTTASAAPTVTALSPTSGPAIGGTSVTITGTNFTGATAVTFGATAATGFTVNSATQITATAPAATGTVDVRITTAGGTSATSTSDQFIYVSGPTVTAISPTSGPASGGTSVTITGTNFSGTTAVTFGATAATGFTVNSATQITATAPAGTGTVDVRITTAGGTSATSASDQFTYVAGPTVTAISPTSGPASGGTSVTITGTNFTGATAVTFGATAATGFTVNSATQITATAPAGTGTVDVRVTTAGGTSATSANDQFTYISAPTITTTGTLSTLTTTYGTASSSTSFTVSGVNMTAGVLVSPPTGFEVSTDNITFSNTVIAGSAGVISQVVYVRLKNTAAANTYAGTNVTLSSAGAANVTTSIPGSTVAPLAISITADTKSKTYGDVDPALTYTSAPALVGTDTFSGSLTRTSGENVGTYAINQGTLALSSNYTVTYVDADLTIGTKAITVTAAAKSKTYGDVDPALTYTFAPALVGTDTFSGSLTRTSGENVGTYAINQGTLALNSNYSLTYVDADLTIGAKAITVTAAAKSKTYGDVDPALTYTFALALVGTDTFTGSLTRTSGENVGTYAINQGTLALSSNYTLTYVDADLTIGAKTVTVTAAAKSKTYGDVDPALTYTSVPALVTGDSFTGSLTRTPGENVGTYAINQGTLALNSNYTLTYVDADLTIGTKAITVTAAAKSKTYGDVDPGLTYTSAPALVTGDSFTGSLTRTPGENVGNYGINQGTLALNSNYTVTYVDADLTIGAKTITVTAAAKSKTYGDADPALTYAPSPLLVTGDSFSGSLSRSPGENVGTYAINQGTLALNSNYTLTYVDADLTIGTKAITVTAAVKSKTYGDADPGLTYTSAPSLVTGDSFSGSLSRSPGENVGTYAINQGTLALNSNYTLTYVGADLTIGSKTITVTAAAKSKTYGDADPTLTYTFVPALVGSDTFTGSLTRQPGENVGIYAINQGTLALSNNYSLTYVGADLTIGSKTITVTAAAKSKIYGNADPALTYTFAPALVTGDSFTGSLTRAMGENVGTYAINQGTLALSNNYTLTYVGADLTIGSKNITVTAAAKSKTFGDADPALTYTFAPALVTGDNFTGSLTRLLGENVGTYAINQGTLALNANYTLTYVGANLTIGKKTITVTAAAKSKTYGEADPALTYTFTPALVTGDSFTGGLSRTAGQNVGMYAINQGTLALNANYTLTYVGSNFSITAKPITVNANASQSKVYGTADPVYTYSVSPALVSGDSFTGALTRAAGNDAGTYQITQGTLSAGTNYTLTYIGNNFTIVKANQTITWNQTLGFGCEGESTVVLTATSNSGLPVSYTSSNSNLVSISGNSLNLLNYGSVTISASQLGNNNYNPAVVVTIPLVNSQPNLIRKQFEDVIFFDNSSKSFNAYSWYKNGVLVAGQTDQYFKENGPLNGTYYAVATKLNGIVVTTCPLVLSPTVEEEYIKIVPNPVKSNGTYELLTNVSSSRLQNARVEVYSVGGLLMENKTTSQNTVSLKAPMVEGIYIVKMTLANGKYFTKNVLVKN